MMTIKSLFAGLTPVMPQKFNKVNLKDRFNNESAQNLIKILVNKDLEVTPYKLSVALRYFQNNSLSSIDHYIAIAKSSDKNKLENQIIEYIKKSSDIALDMLLYISYLDPDEINIEFL